MSNGYVLYNKKAGMAGDYETVHLLDMLFDTTLTFVDIATMQDYRGFFRRMEPDDFVIIAGGDGTLNRFVNDTIGIDIPCRLLYFPNGTGNDFAKELGYQKECNPFSIKQYIEALPTVTVNRKTYRFLNGVGFGIDGYCCEMGDELKKTATKPVNYTSIAIQGLLFRYIPTTATVTVDGVSHTYKKVWIAPTMFGKCYGGGMIPTPNQERNSGKLSVMLYHNAGKLKALRVFPSIFKGKHIKHTNMVEVLTGKEITVEFNEPRSLQIDGETILSVKSYTAKAPVYAAAEIC